MSDWYGSSRSNYFKVKDIKKFNELCERWSINMIRGNDKVGFICEEDYGGLPSYLEDGNKELQFDDFIQELSEHLQDKEVAIMIEVGAQKLAVITGCALAVNSKGKTEFISLNDIYEKAKSLGTNIEEI